MPFRSEVFDFHSRNELEDPFSHFSVALALLLSHSRYSFVRPLAFVSVCARTRAYVRAAAFARYALFALHFLPTRGNLALIEIPPKRVLDEFIWVPPGRRLNCVPVRELRLSARRFRPYLWSHHPIRVLGIDRDLGTTCDATGSTH